MGDSLIAEINCVFRRKTGGTTLMPGDYTIEELEEIMQDGTVDVICPVCGYDDTIESDGDCECPECGEGRLVSPLVELGLI